MEAVETMAYIMAKATACAAESIRMNLSKFIKTCVSSA
jgi:hypothetical protein